MLIRLSNRYSGPRMHLLQIGDTKDVDLHLPLVVEAVTRASTKVAENVTTILALDRVDAPLRHLLVGPIDPLRPDEVALLALGMLHLFLLWTGMTEMPVLLLQLLDDTGTMPARMQMGEHAAMRGT